jgi:hypothetical protein
LFSPQWKPVNGRARSGDRQWYSTDFHFFQDRVFDFCSPRFRVREAKKLDLQRRFAVIYAAKGAVRKTSKASRGHGTIA